MKLLDRWIISLFMSLCSTAHRLLSCSSSTQLIRPSRNISADCQQCTWREDRRSRQSKASCEISPVGLKLCCFRPNVQLSSSVSPRSPASLSLFPHESTLLPVTAFVFFFFGHFSAVCQFLAVNQLVSTFSVQDI